MQLNPTISNGKQLEILGLQDSRWYVTEKVYPRETDLSSS